MKVNLDLSSVDVRERRLKSIISYSGTARDLSERARTAPLDLRERSFGQCSDCAFGCAHVLTSTVRNVTVIDHSPIGCSNGMDRDSAINIAAAARGLPPVTSNLICTNLKEKDTVYGGGEKLRTAIYEAHRRFSPQAIFVHSSCASGIIGDDIEGITDDMQEELGIPIVPVFCEGFKSRIWSTGFDAAYHGILRKILKPPKKKQPDLINIFNFQGVDTFGPLLANFGLRANYVVPLSDVETLETMSEAACTTHICETLATYPAKVLEDYYGVPEVKAPPPFGIEWTEEWLREIGAITGKESEVEAYIKRERDIAMPKIEAMRERLGGRKIYVFAGDSYAHSISNMLLDLGMDLVGITTLHHDQKIDGNLEILHSLTHLVQTKGDIDHFTVCNKQPYQVYKIVRELKPDFLLVRHFNMGVVGAKLGIPTLNDGDVNISAGYDGMIRLGERILQAFKAEKLFRNIKRRTEVPYTDWWLSEPDPFYFEKSSSSREPVEVK